MHTHISPIEENVSGSKEGASSMDPNCAVENLSDTLKLCEPFCLTDIDSSKSLVAPDISRTDVLVGAFDSIRIAESSEHRENAGKDNARLDDVSETQSRDILSRRQSSRTINSNQKKETKKGVRNCRETANKKPLLDLVLVKAKKKTRSSFSIRSRSSAWGWRNFAQVFEQNAGIDVNQAEHKKSRKSRGSRGLGKRSKSQISQSSKKFNGESIASTSRIRLKVKLGKEVIPNCLSDIDNDIDKYLQTRLEFPKLTKDIGGKLEEEVPTSMELQCCYGNLDKNIVLSDASGLDVHATDKYITEKMTGNCMENHHGIPSREEVEGFGVTVDNRCLDPGTSPDSEVINQIPEAPINEKVPEDLHDVLISSQVYVGNGDVTSMNMPQPSSKKAVGKNMLCRIGNSEITDSASLFETYGHRHGHEEKMGDGSYSSEASISNITGSASGNTCSSEGVSMEALPSSRVTDFGVSADILKLESAADVDQCSRSGVGLDSPESRVSEKLPPCTIPKGRKLPKSSTSRGVNKSKSEVPASVSRIGNTGRQKGNQAKLVNKHKLKERAEGDQMVCKVESYTEIETKTGCRTTTPDTSNLDMVPSRLGNQYVSQRNAWVRCDDCYKWRRIAAVLADSIEETNCKWICKDNMDTDFAGCSIPQEKSNSEINAELEISDASCEEDACDARLNSNRLGQKQSTVPQNSSWKLIRSNIFLHRNRKAQTIDEIMVCHCKAPLNGRMGCGDGCLNRMLNIECVKGTCPCGELCSNQQFQKRKYAKLESFRCGKKGHGLQLLEDIPKGQFLIEYVGEVLDTHAYEARQKEYALKGHKHFYFMTLNGSEVIDACAKGNLGRFINHSCEPNCRTEKWMVNGEVCVGLFAMRDIKKGEEVTFDYNYVRVFGAAAKKCVCGSSQCRGYIGGDPHNAELIVQGDSDEEYPEPVMVYEDGDNNKDKVDKPTTAVQHMEITKEAQRPEILLEHKGQSVNSTTAVGHMETTTENEDSKIGSSYAASKLGNSLEMEGSVGLIPCSVQPIETSLAPDDGKSESTCVSAAEQSTSLCTVERLETSPLTTTLGKSLPDSTDIKKSSKADVDRCIVSKSHPRTKTSRSSSSVKKGKSKINAVIAIKPPEIDSKSNVAVPYRSKKLFVGSSNSDFEAVQVKLNELLDADGGISRRKDASRGYLKLLFLTAASGDSGNGEAIQSTRDLSMILDAILKTKSRSVLVDIINKNGLQMLHNIMKRYRREFKKIPVLRKLLKILEFLASKEILTLEHISRAPPCAGVESFRESILTLTEHTDKQVHQIARKFRDTWIPRSMRKHNGMERDIGRKDFHPSSNNSRFSALHNHSSDQNGKPTEANECVKQGTDNLENSSTSCSSSVTNAPKTRKRKSRWDQPAETKEPRIQPISLPNLHSSSVAVTSQSVAVPTDGNNLPQDPLNGGSGMDEDAPPGFSPPISGHLTLSSASTSDDADPTKCPPEVVMGEPQETYISGLPISYGVPLSVGEPQERFFSRLPVSYGIPLSVMQQFGTPQGEIGGNWAIAPGMPFHPFPPLPPYPREKRDPPAENSLGTYHSDPITPSTSGSSPADFETRTGNNQHNFQRARGAPLGRKYFRQQKWNNAKFPPPWVRNRIGTGFMGNNSRNGFCNIGMGGGENPQAQGPYSSGEGFMGMEGSGNCFYPPPPPLPPPPYHHQQNWHY